MSAFAWQMVSVAGGGIAVAALVALAVVQHRASKDKDRRHVAEIDLKDVHSARLIRERDQAQEELRQDRLRYEQVIADLQADAATCVRNWEAMGEAEKMEAIRRFEEGVIR